MAKNCLTLVRDRFLIEIVFKFDLSGGQLTSGTARLCQVCDVVVCGKDNFAQHRQGRQHQLALQKVGKDRQFVNPTTQNVSKDPQLVKPTIQNVVRDGPFVKPTSQNIPKDRQLAKPTTQSRHSSVERSEKNNNSKESNLKREIVVKGKL